MKRNMIILSLLLFALASAAVAVAHQGHDHGILGTVKEVSEDRMVVTKKDATDVTILLAAETKYTKGKAEATRADLAVGSRVSIQVKDDGTTAVTVKIGAATTSG